MKLYFVFDRVPSFTIPDRANEGCFPDWTRVLVGNLQRGRLCFQDYGEILDYDCLAVLEAVLFHHPHNNQYANDIRRKVSIFMHTFFFSPSPLILEDVVELSLVGCYLTAADGRWHGLSKTTCR